MGMGVDPTAIPKRMSREQLEWWILFGICVAGKGAKQTETKVKALLDALHFKYGKRSPFELVRCAVNNLTLLKELEAVKMGQYRRIVNAFASAINLKLDRISVEALEEVPGIGPKTARMIMLYYDPKANCVPLDTHILKWLRAQGVKGVPKSTPSAGREYNRLESLFQQFAQVNNMTVRELDTQVWQSYAKI